MARKTQVKQIVEKVVSEVLEGQFAQMREELVKRVLEEVQPQPGAAGGKNDNGTTDLLAAIVAIQSGSTQKEILRALLDSTVRYCGRAALFVMKGGAATGWQGRGFDDNDSVKDFPLDVNSSGAAQALQSRATAKLAKAEMDPKFLSQFGAPAADEVILLPLHFKDKIAALVYADSGHEAGGNLDTAALELLVAATGAWLEVALLRKQALKESGGAEAAPAPVQSVTSYSDPFAGTTPIHASAHAQAEAPQAEVVVAPAAMAAAAAAAPAPDAFANMSVEDADVHRKAQRFARLLMDEIKLYNQAKVAEGRKHKDLYDRLKEDIDKSRATYNKRYGNTVAASGDYFSGELIRSLAEDDVSLLGANFKR